MISPQYAELVEALIERTKAGDVNWNSTTDPTAFVVYFSEFALSIGLYYPNYSDEETQANVVLKLLNDEGEEIDSEWVEPSDSQWKELFDLFQSARRKALKIDKAVEIITAELRAKKPVGVERSSSKKGDSGYSAAGPVDDDDLPF